MQSMLGEIKLIAPPLIAVGVVVANLVDQLPSSLRIVLDLAALAILFAGFLVLGKLRAQVTAAEGSARAWKEERDAMDARAERLQQENRNLLGEIQVLKVEVANLQARPTLDSLEEEIRKLASLMQATVEVTPSTETGGKAA